MKKQKIRKIRFGLRFKFSLIMIAGVTFTSALIALAVFKQQERSTNDAIVKWGSALLLSPLEDTRKLLQAEHRFVTARGNELSPEKRITLIREATEAGKEIARYYSTIAKREQGIDIAFLVRCDWNDLTTDWSRPDQAYFRYHHRLTGALFAYKSGRYDDTLKPYVYSHYMERMDLSPNIKVTSVQYGQEKREYIILSMPIFRNDVKLYRDYLAFRSSRFYTREEMVKSEKESARLHDLFLERIVSQARKYDYLLVVPGDRERKIVFAVVTRDYQMTKLSPKERTELFKDYQAMLEKTSDAGSISLSAVKDIVEQLRKKYRFEPAARLVPKSAETRDPWKEAFRSFKQYNITMKAKEPLDNLALLSYRLDLAGIHGLFLTRREFYSAIGENRREIIDLIMSILLRCVIIAIFFPTFIIRSIQQLADGAMAIGKGRLDTEIHVKGSDEIGRLADLLNLMTKNLNRAHLEVLEKQRMEDELETAQEIQEALLPKELPHIKGFDFGAYYSAQTESGGDYYDFILLDENRMGITVADVSGHGVGSGLVMAMTRTLLHTSCREFSNLKELLSYINNYLSENTADNYFVTMFYGVLDLRTLEMQFGSAGHLPGLLLRNGVIHEITARGIALGAFDNTVFDDIAQTKKTKFQKGDYFIHYTDGVIEAMDGSRNEYGMERLYRMLQSQQGKTPQQMIDAVMADIQAFIGKTPQHDDITMIAVRIL